MSACRHRHVYKLMELYSCAAADADAAAADAATTDAAVLLR